MPPQLALLALPSSTIFATQVSRLRQHRARPSQAASIRPSPGNSISYSGCQQCQATRNKVFRAQTQKNLARRSPTQTSTFPTTFSHIIRLLSPPRTLTSTQQPSGPRPFFSSTFPVLTVLRPHPSSLALVTHPHFSSLAFITTPHCHNASSHHNNNNASSQQHLTSLS